MLTEALRVHNPLRRPLSQHLYVIILEELTRRVSQALSKRGVGGKLNEELGGACELRSVWNLRNHPDSWLPSEGKACTDGKDKMLLSFYLCQGIFSINALLTKSFKKKNRQVWYRKPDVLFSANERENQQRPWKRHFCLFLVSPADRHSWPLVSQCQLPQTTELEMQTEKRQKNRVCRQRLGHTPIFKRGEEIKLEVISSPPELPQIPFSFYFPWFVELISG